MPVESAADLAVFFNVDEFAVAASYVPPGGGAAVACSVVLDRRDPAARDDDGRPLVQQKTLMVRAAEIAAPAHGGTFTIAGTDYTVANRPRLADPDGRLWTMWIE